VTITIPVWLLWTLGILGGLCVFLPLLFFAFIGWSLRNIRPFG
jgi:hypothetical protein